MNTEEYIYNAKISGITHRWSQLKTAMLDLALIRTLDSTEIGLEKYQGIFITHRPSGYDTSAVDVEAFIKPELISGEFRSSNAIYKIPLFKICENLDIEFLYDSKNRLYGDMALLDILCERLLKISKNSFLVKRNLSILGKGMWWMLAHPKKTIGAFVEIAGELGTAIWKATKQLASEKKSKLFFLKKKPSTKN